MIRHSESFLMLLDLVFHIVIAMIVVFALFALGFLVTWKVLHGQELPTIKLDQNTCVLIVGNPTAIHQFLTCVGLTRVAPPESIAEYCAVIGMAPLGIYQRPQMDYGPLCYHPDEKPDASVCATFDMKAINVSGKTVTCRR